MAEKTGNGHNRWFERHIMLCELFRSGKMAKVSPNARSVFMILYTYANQELEAWPSTATISEQLGLSQRWVRTCLRELESKNIIKCVSSGKGGRNKTTKYKIKAEPSFLLSTQKAEPSFPHRDAKGGTVVRVKAEPQCAKGGTTVPPNIFNEHIQKNTNTEGGFELVSEPEKKKTKNELRANGFGEFWEAWPRSKRKAGKKQCLTHWESNNLSDKMDLIIKNVKAWVNSEDWTKSNGQYIPAPLVYLHKAQWEADTPQEGRAFDDAPEYQKITEIKPF